MHFGLIGLPKRCLWLFNIPPQLTIYLLQKAVILPFMRNIIGWANQHSFAETGSHGAEILKVPKNHRLVVSTLSLSPWEWALTNVKQTLLESGFLLIGVIRSIRSTRKGAAFTNWQVAYFSWCKSYVPRAQHSICALHIQQDQRKLGAVGTSQRWLPWWAKLLVWGIVDLHAQQASSLWTILISYHLRHGNCVHTFCPRVKSSVFNWSRGSLFIHFLCGILLGMTVGGHCVPFAW